MTDIKDQHFLTDLATIRQMVLLADVQKTDSVMDLGAGDGAITKEIPTCKSVIAVENDPALIPALKKIPKATVLEASVLRVPLTADKIISNLPFSAAESWMYHLFRGTFKLAVLLVPSTFLHKLTCGTTTLSLLTLAFFDTKDEGIVEPDALSPEPDTRMRIITLRRKDKPSVPEFFIQQLFLQRDKKVKNALREAYVAWKKATKRQGSEFADSLGLGGVLAKEVPRLTFEDYREILDAIHEKTAQ